MLISEKLKTVKITQGAGDIMAALPYIKALGGEHIYLVINHPNVPTWHPINHGGANALIPLLESQGFKASVVEHCNLYYHVFDIDMDARVDYGWDGSRGDIYTWNSLFYGVYPDMTKQFIHIEDVEQGNYIALTQTARYLNPVIDYRFLNDIDMEKRFIGTEGEWTFVHQLYPGITGLTYHPTEDFYEAAKILKASKVYISNQTSLAVLAEGLAIPRVMVVCPQFPSAVMKTPNGRPVITQRFFENSIVELLNL
jgi:hypothetical protein